MHQQAEVSDILAHVNILNGKMIQSKSVIYEVQDSWESARQRPIQMGVVVQSCWIKEKMMVKVKYVERKMNLVNNLVILLNNTFSSKKVHFEDICCFRNNSWSWTFLESKQDT